MISFDVVESVRDCENLGDLYVLKGMVDKQIELIERDEEEECLND